MTNHVETSNIVDGYFKTIAEKTKESNNYSHKHFSDFLKDKNCKCEHLKEAISKRKILSIRKKSY